MVLEITCEKWHIANCNPITLNNVAEYNVKPYGFGKRLEVTYADGTYDRVNLESAVTVIAR
jgi:hypothetical protein